METKNDLLEIVKSIANEKPEYFCGDSIIEAEHAISLRGDYIGTKIVTNTAANKFGTTQILLDTRERAVIAYWRGEEVFWGYEHSDQVEEYWRQQYQNLQ